MSDQEISAELPAAAGDPAWAGVLARLRRLRLAPAIAAAAVAAIAVHPFDVALQHALRVDEPHPLATVVEAFRVFGKAEVQVLLALLAGWMGRRVPAARSLIALAATAALVLPLKLAVARVRPDHGPDSFPSGDVASLTALIVPLVAGWRSGALSCLAIAAIALGRVMDSRHYPSDVLAGLACGLAAAQAAMLATPALAERIGERAWGFACAGFFAACVVSGLIDHHSFFPVFLAVFAPAIAVATYAARQARPTVAPAISEPRAAWRTAFAIAAAIAVLDAAVAAASTLWDRDEPRFATAALEMWRSGNWLYPTFNGELRPDKPILIYWLMAPVVGLFGNHALAARAWAPVGAAAAALATFALARPLVGARAALWAMAVLGATPLAMACGSAATTDAVLLALIVGSLAVAARLRAAPHSWPLTFALGALLGLAALTKGPVGVVVPLLALAGWHWFERRRGVAGDGAWGRIAIATALGLLLFIAWGVPANHATDGTFAAEGLGRHVVARSVQPLESHGGAFITHLPYYLGVILVAFFPWTFVLPAACSALAGGRLGERPRAVVLGWAVPVLALITLVATKLPHYALPAFPALAIAVGATIAAAERGELSESDRRWLRRGRWPMGAVAAILVLGLAAAPWLEPALRALQGHLPADRAGKLADPIALLATFARPLRLPALAVALVVAALAIGAARARDAAAAARTLLAGVAALGLVLAFEVLPAIERSKASPRLAAAIAARAPADVPVATCGYIEPSLNFALGRRIDRLGVDELPAWSRASGPGFLVIDAERLAGARDRLAPLEMVGRELGLTNSSPRPVELLILGRGLPPRPRPAAKDGGPEGLKGGLRPL